eukprot:scaffold229096_cov23-Tisochrysis_lutea.AAC.2
MNKAPLGSANRAIGQNFCTICVHAAAKNVAIRAVHDGSSTGLHLVRCCCDCCCCKVHGRQYRPAGNFGTLLTRYLEQLCCLWTSSFQFSSTGLL